MISLPGFEGYWLLPATTPRKQKTVKTRCADLLALPLKRATTLRKRKNIKKRRNEK
ncbi:MAG: hypothetical protein HY840_02960 [Bacteroidetes bacterium]|nr:hypothetical protein [Bacteroidota bacterium]